jgi:murein DD-endopeptidase MepM/ murein hydrolase activator NlpD
MAEDKSPEGKKRVSKLRNKYRLVVLNDDTFEEKLSLKLSRLNVFVLSVFSVVILIAATTFLIAFTSLREYIPGYSSTELRRQAIELSLATDTLEENKIYNEIYLANLRNILTGKPAVAVIDTMESDQQRNDTIIPSSVSRDDSLLRQLVEEEERFNLVPESGKISSGLSFFSPIEGLVVTPFDIKEDHLGVDIVADKNEVIKAAQDGIVVFSDWSIETGYVLIIQHRNNFISIYKHNSSILKKQGELVKVGEPVAIVGNSGELTSGPHLHFELWFDGNPVDPQNYIAL